MFGWTQTGSIRGTGSPAEAVWRHAGGKVAEICTMQDQVTTPKQVVLSQQRSVRSTPVLAAGRPDAGAARTCGEGAAGWVLISHVLSPCRLGR